MQKDSWFDQLEKRGIHLTPDQRKKVEENPVFAMRFLEKMCVRSVTLRHVHVIRKKLF